MKNTYDLNDKVALLTGAGSGIGKAMAIAFAQAGAKVMVSDLNEDHGMQVVEEIISSGKIASFVKCNVMNSEDVQNAVKQTVSEFGSLDIAVNNAGAGLPPNLTEDVEEDKFAWLIDLNLTSVFRCMKYELKQMRTQKNGGVILNTASALGITTIAMNSPYVASKHAVIGLTKNAAIEYADKNIRINAICPGVIETPLLFNSPKEVIEASKALHPNKRFGKPEEVAALATWLVSDDSSFVTGSYYTVDGGWTAS